MYYPSTTIPRGARLPVAVMLDMGVAIPRAQGQPRKMLRIREVGPGDARNGRLRANYSARAPEPGGEHLSYGFRALDDVRLFQWDVGTNDPRGRSSKITLQIGLAILNLTGAKKNKNDLKMQWEPIMRMAAVRIDSPHHPTRKAKR